jgi:hypothetical protein
MALSGFPSCRGEFFKIETSFRESGRNSHKQRLFLSILHNLFDNYHKQMSKELMTQALVQMASLAEDLPSAVTAQLLDLFVDAMVWSMLAKSRRDVPRVPCKQASVADGSRKKWSERCLKMPSW